MKTEWAEASDIIIGWIGSKNPTSTDAQNISVTQDLFESRLIKSIFFVDLILLLEDLSDQEINIYDHSVDSFRTLSAIKEKFFI